MRNVGASAAWAALGLNKVAASVEELLGGLRRNKDRLLRMRPAQMSSKLNPLGLMYPEIRPSPMARAPAKQLIKAAPEHVRPYIADGLPYPPGHNTENKVVWPKGNNAEFAHGIIDQHNQFNPPWSQVEAQRLSPQGHKAFNALIGSHELRELSVPLDQLGAFASHRSPRLVAQDRNMLRTLTGPGSEEAGALFNQMRALASENKTLDALLHHYFGERAVKTYGHQVLGAPKIPGRMIDELSRRYRQDATDPARIQALSAALGPLVQPGPAY